MAPLMMMLAAGANAGGPPTGEALVRGYFEMWNTQNPALAAQVAARDVVGHVNNEEFRGVSVLEARVDALKAVYAPAQFVLEEVLVSGDRVVARWTFHGTNTGPFQGRPATGREVTVTGMNLFRISGGRIAEIWVNADDLGELVQLGALERP